MSTLKIEVAINVNLSDSTMSFISALFSGNLPQAPVAPKKAIEQNMPVKPADLAKQATEQVTESAKEVKQETAKEVKQGAAKEEKQQSAEKTTASVTIEEIRSTLGTKVNEHRDAIKMQLEKCEAKNVTTLDVKHYDAFYAFLIAL